jgi:deazaflavin-dependent oxidoreductase (nitroreductase family)
MTNTTAPPITGAALPYGPVMSRLLRPLQRGFLVLNRGFMAPALRAGLGAFIGNPLTGHLMLLRTRGRRSGLVREAPLGYVIDDGMVLCVAGYGETTPWYRNLLDEPRVEVILPARTIVGCRVIRGRAEPVVDDAEWLRGYRALISSFGIVGRLVAGDPSRVDDPTLLATSRALPVVRITPDDPADRPVAGPYDPGGNGWFVTVLVPTLAGLLLGASLVGAMAGRRSAVRPATGSTMPSARPVAPSASRAS